MPAEVRTQTARRIVRLSDSREWGWEIVNFLKYRALRSQEERREYMRQYQRDRRAVVGSTVRKQPSTIVNNVTDAVGSTKDVVCNKQRKGKARMPPQNHIRNLTLPDPDKALLALRKAVWVRGHDGTKDIQWDKLPEAVRERTRSAWLASGWSVQEFRRGQGLRKLEAVSFGFRCGRRRTRPIRTGDEARLAMLPSSAAGDSSRTSTSERSSKTWRTE